MKAILCTLLFLGFVVAEISSMDAARQAEMNRQAEQARQQREAQYAATQRHYAEQSAMIAQREQARQNAEQQRLNQVNFLNKK